MRKINISLIALFSVIALSAQSSNHRSDKVHDRSQPQPPIVEPGKVSTQKKVGTAPSDAIVLFDGSSTNAWVDNTGEPIQWKIKDGVLVCEPHTGAIRTLQNFGDCQLHIEWATPTKIEGDGQGRSNSGVFFGGDRYEVQILDSFENPTYADGGAGSVYGQWAPLANATLPSGQWQTYDIIYTAPKFTMSGELKAPAKLTVLHNGVLIQNESVLDGPTAWINRPPYQAHPEKLPIALQDHGNPVSFRNIWVRELGPKTPAEYTYTREYLETLAGSYKRDHGAGVMIFVDENGALKMKIAGEELRLYAQSKTQFVAKTTDIICDFGQHATNKILKISVGAGWSELTLEQ